MPSESHQYPFSARGYQKAQERNLLTRRGLRPQFPHSKPNVTRTTVRTCIGSYRR